MKMPGVEPNPQGEFPTVLKDGGVASEWWDATHVGFAVEEEIEDGLVVVGARFGDDIVEIGSMMANGAKRFGALAPSNIALERRTWIAFSAAPIA